MSDIHLIDWENMELCEKLPFPATKEDIGHSTVVHSQERHYARKNIDYTLIDPEENLMVVPKIDCDSFYLLIF